ncbi:MAG: NAD(P)/FAD-dependent oxidoreductase [Spirochaetales bacterium]|nr:NAD(P)/FAD-dependent oxidoreductase [Spirochaetales bacterium]
MNQKRIVIVGGGYGGVHAAKKLSKQFKRKSNVKITLIDKKPYHTLMTELHEVAGGRVGPDAVKVSFKKIFAARNVEFSLDTVKDIDFENQRVIGDHYYSYDYLVLGTGAQPNDFGISGIKEHGYTLWSMEDAIRIRSHTERMFIEASEERDPQKRQEMLTFVIAGAGFTGIEMAGELLERKGSLCRQYDIDPEDVRIFIIEALSEVLPMLTKEQQEKTIAYLKKQNAEVVLNSKITKATASEVHMHTGKVINSRTLIWTCGVWGTDFAASLKIEQGHVNRQRVNEFMQSPSHENVYLVGDMIWYLENEKALPQIVETAVQTADVAAANIIQDITKKGEKKPFKSNYHGHMVSVGGRWGLSNNMGLKFSGFIAQGIKHLINVIHLFGLAGVNAVWGYLQHEFLSVKDKRSIIGGHLAAKVPVYWVAVLRVFLGAKWLYEGIKKIIDGWLDPANIYIVQMEGVSAASEWGETAAEETAQWAAPLLSEPLGIYNWIVDTFVMLNPYLFQAGIVIAEIALGLAFIGGLFTFLAAAASIGLCIMLIIGAMAGSEILWYLAAAVVMLGGAGKGLGLDYWAMPFFKKIWNGTKLAKKTYLYIGEPED